jgi:dipeptidase D
MARSSAPGDLADAEKSINSIARSADALAETGERYPGWNPDINSKVLAVARESFKNVLGSEAKVEAIHAGLECGIIGERIPGLDMISIGPDIRGAHSPDERVNVKSVETFWEVFVDILRAL